MVYCAHFRFHTVHTGVLALELNLPLSIVTQSRPLRRTPHVGRDSAETCNSVAYLLYVNNVL